METFYFIAGKGGNGKSVSMYHTNAYLKYFHWDIHKCVDMFYDHVEEGNYLSKRGYQNGYGDVGYMLITVKKYEIAHSSNGRTSDSDSEYCGSNPW